MEKLYPSIPIREALDLVECLLKSKPDLRGKTSYSVNSIMSLLRWMFSQTYCEYNGDYYSLDSGPIGLGVTGELAIIYMEDFQIRAISTSPYQLEQWFWYVDDSETKCKSDEAKLILDHLNSIEPDIICFTMEELLNDEISVLDLKQKIDRKTKSIEFSVNYKKTHTNINVDARSNHPEMMKKAIIW